jgi:hypothetical protein
MLVGSLGFIIVAVPGTKVQFSANNITVRSMRIQPRSAALVPNVGNVYLKNASGQIYAVLSPEQVDGRLFIPMGDSELLDLSQWWVDADSAGDGILCGYVK